MENEPLKLMHTFIGKVFDESPSPFMNWLQPTIVKAEAGSLKFSYLIRREMTNPHKILHGGVTAGIIDDLIGATIYTLNFTHPFTTVNNYIDYFAPAKEGDLIVAETTIVKRGRNIMNLACEVWLPAKERLIAKGYSNMLRLE